MRAHRFTAKTSVAPPGDANACGEVESAPGIPGCDTGPAGRLAWTVREILDVIRRRS